MLPRASVESGCIGGNPKPVARRSRKQSRSNHLKPDCEIELLQITAPHPDGHYRSLLLPGNDRLVNDGYTFDVPNGEGVFDGERSRVAFWVSSFP